MKYEFTVISYHNHYVPAISYHSENHFRTITISYHCHFVPYSDLYMITISYHMQIDTLYDHFVPYADKYIMTISYHMQNLMQIVHLALFYINSNKCYTQVHAACWYGKTVCI